ncbi:hypothetical protein R6Q57_021461 [Mikania cordata]
MACLVPELVTPKIKRIKRYIQRLPADIRRPVKTTNPTTLGFVVDINGMLYDERDHVILFEPKKDENNINNKSKKFRNNNYMPEERKDKMPKQESELEP